MPEKVKLSKIITTKQEVTYLSINLRFLRTLNQMTQAEASKKFKVSRALIGAYEEGRARPPYEALIKMSDWYGVTVDDILKKEITSVSPKE